MKRVTAVGAFAVGLLLVVGVCLGLAVALWGSAVADPDASCPDDPNPLRLFPPTVDIACVPSLWGEWHGREVVVTGGPYGGWVGVVQEVSGDHVRVAFLGVRHRPDLPELGLWFREEQLDLVKEAPGAE